MKQADRYVSWTEQDDGIPGEDKKEAYDIGYELGYEKGYYKASGWAGLIILFLMFYFLA